MKQGLCIGMCAALDIQTILLTYKNVFVDVQAHPTPFPVRGGFFPIFKIF